MEFDNDRIIRPTQKVEMFAWIFLLLLNPLVNCLTIVLPEHRGAGIFIAAFLLSVLINAMVLSAYIVFARIFVSRFLFRKKYVFFALISIGWFMVIHAFLLMIYSITLNIDFSPTGIAYFTYSAATILRESLWIIINMGIATAICFIRETLDKEDMVTFLQKDNAFLKIRYLRTQLNPHFLFNTLNSIYSLSLQKSDKTPEVVIKLADIMRYLIDECSQEKIPLTKEIDFIRNYIEIEKIRFKADIRFTVEGETEDILIEPFLFISFIENGFKHALDNSQTLPFIYVTLKIEPDRFILNVINNTDIDLENQAKRIHGRSITNSRSILEILYRDAYALDIIQTEKDERKESKLRLKNAKERLETLYPDNHTLDVILSNNTFTVSLIIKRRAA